MALSKIVADSIGSNAVVGALSDNAPITAVVCNESAIILDRDIIFSF